LVLPVLSWIGKEAIVNHDKEVPFRLLKKVKRLSVGESENLIIEGDNLEGLKALLPYYQNKIKCIFIDPPYNTGNEKWKYNDNNNAPKIKQWLGKIVDREDLTRHDKWLCMMHPRLVLLKDLLRDDGVIFITIDDNELYNLMGIMNEIFGSDNFVATYIWEARSGKGATAENVVITHEYVVCFSKKIDALELQKDVRVKTGGTDKDEKGWYKREQLRQWGQEDSRAARQTMGYPIPTPDGSQVYPIKDDGSEGRWRVGKDTMRSLLKENDIDFILDESTPQKWQVYKKIREGNISKTAFGTFLFDLGTASTGTIEIQKIFGSKVFDTIKPVNLIKRLITLCQTKDDDIVLDSFAGTGTTGQAVLELNKEDSGNRKFILLEMESKICKNITSQRIKKAIRGYSYKSMNFDALGGGFQYCVLSKPLFDKDGKIDQDCTFEDLASYIYFTETKTILDKNKISKNFIGEHSETKYYLIFREIGKNTLTTSFLKGLDKESRKVIYADNCTISEDELERRNIVFKQIPYEVRVF